MVLSKELHYFPIAGETPLVVMRIDNYNEKRTVNQVTYSAHQHCGGMATPKYSPHLMRVTAPLESADMICNIVAAFAEKYKDDSGRPAVTIEQIHRSKRDASVAFEVTAAPRSMEVFDVLRRHAFVTHHAPLLTSQYKALQATFRLKQNTATRQTVYKDSAELFITLAYNWGADATLRDRQLRVTVQDRTHLTEFVKCAVALDMFYVYDVPAIYAGHQVVKRATQDSTKPRYAIKSLGPATIDTFRDLAAAIGVTLDESRVSSKFMPLVVPDTFTPPRVDQTKFPGMTIGLLNEHTFAESATVTPVPQTAAWKPAPSAPRPMTVFTGSADGAGPAAAQLGPAPTAQPAAAAGAAAAAVSSPQAANVATSVATTPAQSAAATAAVDAALHPSPPAPPVASASKVVPKPGAKAVTRIGGSAAAAGSVTAAVAPRAGFQPESGSSASATTSDEDAAGAAAKRPIKH
jgi:hypothetical protein